MTGPSYTRRCDGSADRPRSVEAAGADVRQVALTLRLTSVHTKAPSGSDSSPFSSFLGAAASISAPGTLQELKTAVVIADGSVLPKNSCFTSSYTA